MGDERPRFDWDKANRRHIARHNVLPEEVEQTILDPYAIFLEIQTGGDEERTKVLGSTNSGRVLAVIFSFRGEVIRPITAYPAPTQLQALYLKQRRL